MVEKQDPAKTSIRHRASLGVLWGLIQVFLTKGVSILGQILLAWFLLPEDFGLVGLAYTVTAFATLIQNAGVREVLIHRHRNLKRWTTAAFWMSLTSGTLAGLVMSALAPFIAAAYGEPQLTGLILVVALASPIVAVSNVPRAILESKMRFSLLARVGVLESVMQMGLAVLLAAAGFGPYSFLIPRPIAAIVRLILEWRGAKLKVRWALHLRRWKYLFGDTSVTFGGGVMIAIIAQGDYIVLGAMFSAEMVGLYFFAFYFAMQPIQVLTGTLVRVLLPALTAFDKVTDQTRVFVKVCSLLALVGTPLAFLQAIIAEPLIHLLFEKRWDPAILLIQILSIATAFRVILSAGGSLLQAQGRFKFRFILFSIYAPVFLLMVYIGAVAGASIGVAIAVSLFYTILGIFHFWLVIVHGGGMIRDTWRVYTIPMLASAFSSVLAWFASDSMAANATHEMIRIIITSTIFLACYYFTIKTVAPTRIKDFISYFKSLRSHTP